MLTGGYNYYSIAIVTSGARVFLESVVVTRSSLNVLLSTVIPTMHLSLICLAYSILPIYKESNDNISSQRKTAQPSEHGKNTKCVHSLTFPSKCVMWSLNWRMPPCQMIIE